MLNKKIVNFNSLENYFLDANEKRENSSKNTPDTEKISSLKKITIKNITSEDLQNKFREETRSIALSEEDYDEGINNNYNDTCIIGNNAEKINKLQNNDLNEQLFDSPFSKIDYFEDDNGIDIIECGEGSKKPEDFYRESDGFLCGNYTYNSEEIDSNEGIDSVDCNIEEPMPQAVSQEIINKAEKDGKRWVHRFLSFYKSRMLKGFGNDREDFISLLESNEDKKHSLDKVWNRVEAAFELFFDNNNSESENTGSEDDDYPTSNDINNNVIYLVNNSYSCPKADSWADYVMNN